MGANKTIEDEEAEIKIGKKNQPTSAEKEWKTSSEETIVDNK